MCYPIVWLYVFLPDCRVLLSITLYIYIYIMLQNCLVVCCNQVNNWLCIPLPNCFVMHYHSGVCAVSVLFGCVCVGLPNCLVMCVVTHLFVCVVTKLIGCVCILCKQIKTGMLTELCVVVTEQSSSQHVCCVVLMDCLDC